jgi:23S rRNA (cytosine1962-C5)-methyltransferase
MFSSDNYQFLDFGGGRRLERFGSIVLDRPCPAAERFEQTDRAAWQRADARFEGRDQEKGTWTDHRELPERWTIQFGALQFELKRTDFGHLGIFPEQVENWNWIAEQCRVAAAAANRIGTGPQPRGTEEVGDVSFLKMDSHSRQLPPSPAELDIPSAAKRDMDIPGPHPRPLSQRERGVLLKVLNLFAYTGGSTLAAAAGGAEVVHVDAAKNIVAWARRNAELSVLSAAPIRWIAEDAMKFVKREIQRGNRYDAVILDPPSYGHGPRGEVWRLSKHLPVLLSLCAELTNGRPEFMLLTCHTPGYDAATLQQMMQEALGDEGEVVAGSLTIRSVAGRDLPSGVFVRYRKQPCEAASG